MQPSKIHWFRSFGLCRGWAAGWGLAAEKPNILWITCEDISPYLGCYGFEQAHTPHLDRLAQRGVRYTRAYANAPVCGVARSTLLTGMYATTTGTHQMRCRTPLPAIIPAYPNLLRKIGYYCTNRVKTDYNSSYEAEKERLWDEVSDTAHWENRSAEQPFFAVFNFTTTHESQLSEKRILHYVKSGQIPARPRIDPVQIQLPPYHPDLPEIREDWARLHDLITRMDEQVGEVLHELERSGEAEDTIIFFYADHGGMISRSKRYIYNTGTQVPLIVVVPEKWQHLAGSEPGSVCERLVSFVDFPKTILALTGAEIPDLMQGRVFLGEKTESEPGTVHFYRDRMSERPDFSRAVTDGRFYLVRNFMPHRPHARDTRYGYGMQANWRAWEQYYEEGVCDSIQAQFFQPKPVLEFFDTEQDPWQVRNLVEEPAYQQRVTELAQELDQWMISTRDTGLIPEPMVAELVGVGQPHRTLYEFAQSDQYPVAELLEIAKQSALGARASVDNYLEFLQHAHPVARYHGAYALFLARSEDAEVRDALRKMSAADPLTANRIMAAQALGRCGEPETAYDALRRELDVTADGYVFLYALNALQYAHVDDRLTQEDWEAFQSKKLAANSDPFGAEMAQRIVTDALEKLPERRIVD